MSVTTDDSVCVRGTVDKLRGRQIRKGVVSDTFKVIPKHTPWGRCNFSERSLQTAAHACVVV